MSGSALAWVAKVLEDGTFSVLARVCSLDGSGEEVVQGEGKVVQQADVSSITCKVYDLGTDRNNDSGVEITPSPTLTPSANVFDTLRTVGWAADTFGYNFRHDVGAAYVPDGGEWVLIEHKITFVGGGVAWVLGTAQARKVRTS